MRELSYPYQQWSRLGPIELHGELYKTF